MDAQELVRRFQNTPPEERRLLKKAHDSRLRSENRQVNDRNSSDPVYRAALEAVFRMQAGEFCTGSDVDAYSTQSDQGFRCIPITDSAPFRSLDQSGSGRGSRRSEATHVIVPEMIS
jgi:hypothetical protein